MGIRPTLLDVVRVQLAGNWANADRYTVGQETSLLIQNRADDDIQIATQRNTDDYFTVKNGLSVIIPCMNSQGTVLFFRGPAGAEIEILRQHDI
jgi:hypothetical protein